MRWLLAIVLSSCAAPAASVVEHPAPPPAASASGTAAPAAGKEAAPAEQTIALPGGGNALWWDAASSTLYLTDSNASALVAWTAAAGLHPVAQLPADAAGVSLGGIVRRPDGTLVVANFGFGTHGGLFAVADGNATALTGLDPVRLRVGLAQDAAGAVYSAYFVGGRGKPQHGGVSLVTFAGAAASETEIASGFHKAVGVAATPSTVYVADQTDKAIFKVAVPGYAVSKLATAPSVDLLLLLPDGDLLTGGGATISRITPAGEVSALRGSFEQVRGLAYDAAGKRLFVVDHSVTVGVPDKLRILPLAE